MKFSTLLRWLLATAMLILMPMLLFSLAACTGDDPVEEPTSAPSDTDAVPPATEAPTAEETVTEAMTEPETEPVPAVASMTESGFVIVCAADGGEAVRAQADRLSAELGRLYGTAPAVVTDGETEAAYEIRVGKTSRGGDILPADAPYAWGIAVDAQAGRAVITLDAAREDFLARAVTRLLDIVPATEGTLLLSDIKPVVDDGAAFATSLVVAVDGVTDYTAVLVGENTDETYLSLQWIAHRLQLAGVAINVKGSIQEEGRYITTLVDGAMTEDWKVTFDEAGNITVAGRDARMITLGLAEFSAVLAPNEFGDILIADTKTIIGDSAPYDREGWTLAMPAYEGGVLSDAAYEIGSGIENDNKQDRWSNGRMMMVREATEEDFEAYGSLLERYGYVPDSESTLEAPKGVNRYAEYVRGLSLVYVYYNASEEAVRIVEDRASVRESDFEYTFAHTADTPTDMILYGLKMHPLGINADEPGGDPTIQNCGAFLMIAQADGSLFVIDGGSKLQATDAAVEGTWRYMHEVTGTPMGEPIRIACWFMTHPHSDHYAMMAGLFEKYRDQIILERVMFNFQSERATGMYVTDAMRKCVRDHYPETLYLKCHTGQSIQLGSLTIDVITTHEDAVNLDTGRTSAVGGNSTTTVLRVTFADGSRVMILGDTTEDREQPTVRTMAKDELACDMVQIAHHAWNSMGRLYRGVGAKYTLWPQYEPSNFVGAHYDWAQTVKRQVVTAGAEYFYYAGLNTVRLTWRNHEVEVTLADVVC